MLIEYKATKHRLKVRDETGRRLVASGIAREVKAAPTEEVAQPAKKKRTYKRRDMQANNGNAYQTRDMRSEEE